MNQIQTMASAKQNRKRGSTQLAAPQSVQLQMELTELESPSQCDSLTNCQANANESANSTALSSTTPLPAEALLALDAPATPVVVLPTKQETTAAAASSTQETTPSMARVTEPRRATKSKRRPLSSAMDPAGPKPPTTPVIVDHATFLKEQAKQMKDRPTPITKPSLPAPHPKLKRTFRYIPASFAKLTDFDLERFLLDARLSPEAEAYVREAFAAPSRHLSGVKSHTILYPAIRFGHSLKFESRNVEYAFALMMIYRPDVFCVLEQPPSIKVTYPGGWSEYTPDLLVLTSAGIEIWEARPAERLADQCIKKPHLYRETKGVYEAPLFQEYFTKLGFKYAIATEHVIHKRFCNSVEFLHPYLQGTPSDPITSEEREQFIGCVRKHSGIRLADIPIENATRKTELALYFLATAAVFTSLSEADFTNPGALRIYATAQDEAAFHLYLKYARPRPADLTELGYRLKHGAYIEIRGIGYKVAALTSTRVRLEPLEPNEDSEPIEPTHRQLLDLKPRIGRIYNAEKTFERMFQDAPMEHRLTHAAKKIRILPYLPGGELSHQRPTDHTTRRWLREFEKMEAKGLNGDEALFPQFSESGRKKCKLAPEIAAEFSRLVDEHHQNPKGCTVQWVWKLLLHKFGKTRLPSVDTIYRRVRDIDAHQQARNREGQRGAVATQANYGDSPIWGSPHGTRSFQKAHIDSTPVDLRLESEEGHYLAKMVDPFDGRVLAEVVTAEAPSELTIRALLLECVRRHGALPGYISCDFGPEHRTVWLQESLAALGIILDIRPKSDPAKGGPVESAFSALCKELIHNLQANTKLMRRARLVTKTVNPDQFAIWTSVDLRALIQEYVSLRNDLPRSDKPSPNDIAAASYEKYGVPPRNTPTPEELQVLLLPFVERETRTVSKRGVIKANNFRYGIKGEVNDLRRFAGKEVKVRWVPEDPNVVWVFTDSPRRAFRCVKLNCTGPADDILDAARVIFKQRAAADPELGNPPARAAKFTADVVEKEEQLTARKKRKAKSAKAGRAKAASEADDENVATVNIT